MAASAAGSAEKSLPVLVKFMVTATAATKTAATEILPIIFIAFLNLKFTTLFRPVSEGVSTVSGAVSFLEAS